MKIDIPKYDRGSGLQLCWSDDFTIKVTSENDEVVISANREGLISLANHLLNLAQTDVPCGTHIHLDENNSLEDGSQSIIRRYETVETDISNDGITSYRGNNNALCCA